jgi:hypothetical protein
MVQIESLEINQVTSEVLTFCPVTTVGFPVAGIGRIRFIQRETPLFLNYV